VIEPSFFTILVNLAGATFRNSDLSYRIYPARLEQGTTLPAMVYTIIDEPNEHSHTGSSNLRHPRIQLDVWAADYDAAMVLGEAVDTSLDGYKSVVGSNRIDGILRQNDRPMYDEDSRTWRRSMDYIVTYAEL
jgi:hypothetical protein